MPHKPGHGTQRRRIERQARGQSPTSISKSSVSAAKSALASAEANRLNNLVSRGQSDNVYRNQPNVFVPQEVVSESNPLNIPQKALDFVAKNTDEFGRMNEAAKARIDMYTDGIGDYKYVDDRRQVRTASAVFDKLTPYQRDLNAFIQSSPESAAAYKSRFPITNALMTGLPTLFTSVVPGFNLAKNVLLSAMGSTRDAGSDAVNSLKQIAINKGILAPDTINQQTGTTARADELLQAGIKSLDVDTNPLLAPDVNPQIDFDQPIRASGNRFERIFKLPFDSNKAFNIYDLSQIPPQSTGQAGNYLVRDPSIRTPFINNQLTGMNMNQGGLASINNPEYTMLRRASDFDI